MRLRTIAVLIGERNMMQLTWRFLHKWNGRALLHGPSGSDTLLWVRTFETCSAKVGCKVEGRGKEANKGHDETFSKVTSVSAVGRSAVKEQRAIDVKLDLYVVWGLNDKWMRMQEEEGENERSMRGDPLSLRFLQQTASYE